MVRAICSALRLAVPLNTRCSMRCDMPARSSGSCREPVSTQTPTATERTWDIRSVTSRMPLGRTAFRLPSLTGRIRRVGVLELLLGGQRGLVAQRHLPAQPHLAVAVDLDHLDGHHVALSEHVLDGADAALGDLRYMQQAFSVRDHFDKGAELHDLLHLAHVDAIQLDLATDVLDHPDGLLDGDAVGGKDGHPAIVL